MSSSLNSSLGPEAGSQRDDDHGGQSERQGSGDDIVNHPEETTRRTGERQQQSPQEQDLSPRVDRVTNEFEEGLNRIDNSLHQQQQREDQDNDEDQRRATETNANQVNPNNEDNVFSVGIGRIFSFQVHSSLSTRIGTRIFVNNNNVNNGVPPTNNPNLNNNNPIPVQNNLHSVRSRLFRVIFMKIALIYATAVPSKLRKLFEYLLLLSAILSLALLFYLHVTFIRNPVSCLQGVSFNDKESGVLRLEIIFEDDQEKYVGSEDPLIVISDEDLELKANRLLDQYQDIMNVSSPVDQHEEAKKIHHQQTTSLMNTEQNNYILEYSLEYGLLRLSSKTRTKLQIPVQVVKLDPENDVCFGDVFSRFLLKNILGYDDLLMSSLKSLAESEGNNKGFVRNVITGDQYRFVSLWLTRSSYFAAAFIMVLFTVCISLLLRYSHHQVFVFVTQLMTALDHHNQGNNNNHENTLLLFPFAPLLTVILALVGMETVMSDFFNDSTTAFYVILIVWEADQFDVLCCHSSTSKKHWLKFFFLYHFFFYAYDYRFNGQYSGLALFSSWLLIQHSMVYFFHRFELPLILEEQERNNLLLNNNGQQQQPNQAEMNQGIRPMFQARVIGRVRLHQD